MWLALAVIASAIAVNMAGYTRLADLVGGAMIRSAYIAVVFYALTRIAEGLVLGLLHIPPITLLGMVRRHRSLIAQRLNQWVRWAVALFWAAITLQMLRLLRPLVSEARVALAAPATVGSIAISGEQVIAFLLLIWAAFLVSRFLRFALDDRNPQVAATPAPQALFNKVGPESLEFELRVWTDAESGRSGLRSDLVSKISEALHQHQIAVR